MKCPECNVPLFRSEEEAEEKFPTAILWEGDHPDFFNSLLDELTSDGVSHYGAKRSVGYYSAADGPRFYVVVPQAELEWAKRVLAEIQEEYEVDQNAALGVQRTICLGDAPREETFGDWDEQDPAYEVWSGADGALASSLRDCLRENDIPYRTVRGSSAGERIVVHPEDATRAREIVREVLEGAPPA
jgi:hypothetical protein